SQPAGVSVRVQWLCLPDEVWLSILSLLPHSDLCRVLQVCSRLHTLATDHTLWERVSIENSNLTEQWLLCVSRRRPRRLCLYSCSGLSLTSCVLEMIFTLCRNTLQELKVISCTGPGLHGDQMLLLIGQLCDHVTSVDVSWSGATDTGVKALGDCCSGLQLKSVVLNGCHVTDDPLIKLVMRHKESLCRLEVFGCQFLTPSCLQTVYEVCPGLQHLNIGQVPKVNAHCLAVMTLQLKCLISLNVTGLQVVTDAAMDTLLQNCVKLQSLTFSSCPGVTDMTLHRISKYTTCISQPHPSIKGMSSEEQDRLRSLFHAYDADNSGRIERKQFLTICAELQVSAAEADRIFNRLDVDQDGTVTLQEFINGFHDRYGGDMELEQRRHVRRLGALREQDGRAGQVHSPERRTKHQCSSVKWRRRWNTAFMPQKEKHRDQEKKRTDAALSDLRSSYETEVCELQCKIQTMQMIEEKYKNITGRDESQALKKKINELTLENQRLKQDLLKSQTKVACLHSELDSLKTELTDQSISSERDEELMQHFSDERDILENQIEILQTANRKLHDSNDGLRAALERTTRGNGLSTEDIKNRSRSRSICYTSPYALMDRVCQRMDDFPLYPRRPSCDTLALAMCDPGLKRRHSSECEVDSLPEIYMDSGLSTLRGSHGGYDSEQEVKGQEEEEEEKREDYNNDSVMGENSDTEPAETQDGESAFGSDSSSVLDWKPSESLSVTNPPAPTIRKALSAISVQKEDTDNTDLGYMTSEKAYRIVLAGDAAVGKSSFLLRLCKNEFKLNSSATLGVDFQMKTLIVDGEPVLLQLWDTAGQERFRSIAKSYFRRADGVLLLYDVTCEKSFLNVREWVDMIEDVSQEDIPIMLVGNKSDLRQDGVSCVPTSYGEKLAMTYNTLFCETSAKDGSNTLEAVLHLARSDKSCFPRSRCEARAVGIQIVVFSSLHLLNFGSVEVEGFY
ncbi:Ras and EF-hand domain-containing protein, partial [Nibea albiflora]